MKHRSKALVAAGAAIASIAAGMTGAEAATGCQTRWGSLPEGTSAMARGTIENVRSGRHACFDRLVVDVEGKVGRAYDARYVRAVAADGSGQRVPLRGGAFVQLVVRAPAYSEAGTSTYLPANRREVVAVGGYRTLRQVAWAGSFEGQTTLGVGVRARLPFRVTVLDGPGKGSRVVLDVAHRW